MLATGGSPVALEPVEDGVEPKLSTTKELLPGFVFPAGFAFVLVVVLMPVEPTSALLAPLPTLVCLLIEDLLFFLLPALIVLTAGAADRLSPCLLVAHFRLPVSPLKLDLLLVGTPLDTC